MKSINWTAALALSLGVGLVAGCGQSASPVATAPMANSQQAAAGAQNAAYSGPLSAQVDDTTASASPSTTASASPTATGSAMPSASPSATASAGTGTGTDTGTGSMTGSGTLGDTRVGGVSGSISTSTDRGLGAFSFGAGDLVAFQSNRQTGGGGAYDIFVYDAQAQTVLALPAVNTGANETNPRLSTNGQWLVYQTDESGTQDVRTFDLRTQLIDTLRTLNTETHNEMQPDISDDGSQIVYVSDEPGGNAGQSGTAQTDTLRIYNTHNGADYIVPVANRGLTDITWPTMSGNGDVIAYGASSGGPNRQIFVYSVKDAAQLTPPFLNDVNADQYNPDLDESGNNIVFVSNRRGSEDIYMTDLRSGFTDNMVLANSSGTEQEPRFLGRQAGRVVFQSDRTGEFRIYAYDMNTALLDTLPVANELDSDTQIRNVNPSL